jgi:putative phosphoesterase
LRIAVFSDIHGNCVAFDSVLTDIDAQHIDGMVCLGDAIQGGAQPAETVSRLRERRVPTVMGNSDSWLLGGVHPDDKESITESQRDVRAWSLSRLKNEDREFIRQFRSTVRLALGERDMLCFHGSPGSFNDLIWPTTTEAEFTRMVGEQGNAILCGGHTHLQQLRRVGDSFFFNPGSVGFSWNHSHTSEKLRADPWAEYAVVSLEGTTIGVEFRRVPFDVRELVRLATAAGRPHADEMAAEYL